MITGLFLLGAGVVAGIVGTAGGITSLVAYPALLAVGIPPLAATGSAVLLLQPVISARSGAPDRAVIAVSGAGVAVYNGYFGAGSGILMITLPLLTTETVLHRANSLKNVILFAAHRHLLPPPCYRRVKVGRLIVNAPHAPRREATSLKACSKQAAGNEASRHRPTLSSTRWPNPAATPPGPG